MTRRPMRGTMTLLALVGSFSGTTRRSPRPDTDWRVLTVGFDSNSSAGQPVTVQVAVDNVLIGVRCNEQDWQAPSIAGC